MNPSLVLFVMLCVLGIGLSLGMSIGFQMRDHGRCAGDLVIAPGDEDAPNYMFLELAKEPDELGNNDRVVLNVRRIGREKNTLPYGENSK